MTTYDSTPDTLAHIQRVQALLTDMQRNLAERVQQHDASKLQEPEKPLFDEYTPKLRTCVFGSPKYQAFLAELKPALDHHYAMNSHHPEHYPNGIAGMSLLDLIEMLCDWKASTERSEGGDIRRSLRLNQNRFGIDAQLVSILENTMRELQW
jgi:hypothetical protein